MNSHRPNPEELLDRAVEAVRDEPLDERGFAAVRERVERRLRAELDAAPAAGESIHRIHGCDGFRSLIPAYLAGALSEPRRMLFEDHTRECVPCRRALAEARRGAPAGPAWGERRRTLSPGWRYALAAGLVGLVAASGAMLTGRLGWFGPDASARVRSISGELVALDGGKVRAVPAGEQLQRGATVRTASDSGAVLELTDGSHVELAERSELTLARRSDGVVLDLSRGALIVEAAKQRRGHLYVRTDDCLVSVVGTIFSVNHGVRGSRVSVLDGEVRVRQGAELAVLRPGDQLATSKQLRRVALESEISWSVNADEYRARIEALAALGREIDQRLATPGERTSTRLLDLAPADTAIWLGLPNVSDQIADAWQLVEQRVAENPALAGWWSERFGDGVEASRIADGLEHLRELGSHLGGEIAVAVGVDGSGKPGEPIFLAEVSDPRGFDDLLASEVARVNTEAGATRLVRVDDPEAIASSDEALYVWHSPAGLLVASPAASRLAATAAAVAGSGSGFSSTAFHARLAAVYRDGAGWLLGVDAGRVLAHAADQEIDGGAFAALGLADAQHFLVESETVDGTNETRAALGFAGARRGVAAWLAAPAPSGALEFVSPNASFAVAGVSKRPVEMLDELLAIADAEPDANASSQLAELEAKLGFSLRDDVAATLGGDAAFALDGPLLPKPAWKLAVEVIDPSRLEYAVGRAVEAANREAAAAGKPGLRFGQEESSGHRFLTLASDAGVEIAAMTFVDGYLVAAPSKALVLDALALRAAGSSLMTSPAFLERLPRDADPNFSAVVWQNFGGATGPLGDLLGSVVLPDEQRAEIEALTRELGPTLVVAYGDSDRIRFVARGGNGPLGLSFERLLALAGAIRGDAASAGDGTTGETPVRTTA